MLINGVEIDLEKITKEEKNKTKAIKKVRELTGVTLSEAANIVQTNGGREYLKKEKSKNILYAVILIILGIGCIFTNIIICSPFFFFLAFCCIINNMGKTNYCTKDNKIEKNNKEISEDKAFYDELNKLPGFDSFGTRKEIKYLKTVLYENESVLAIASGIMDGNTWLIACTNKRVLFIDSGLLYGVKHSEIMINKINSISFVNGISLGEIHIEDGASTRIIKNVLKTSTKPFVDAVHKAMEMYDERKSTVQYQSTSSADELLKFKQLLDMGVITQDEFEIQKSKLLK